MTARIRTARTG
jgi:hypothetical protein